MQRLNGQAVDGCCTRGQAEIARILGVSRQLVTDWFRAKATPTWNTGLKIQVFLKTQKPGKNDKP